MARSAAAPARANAISYDEALRMVLAQCRPLPAEAVPFDATVGRVLAEPVHAAGAEPPAPKSGMDGFALRAADTRGASPQAPLRFTYEQVLAAGGAAGAAMAPHGAARIMTGALLPAGADAVVKQEDTQQSEPGAFALTAPLEPGDNVIAAGSILRQGQALLAAGQVVTAQAVALLAGQGRAQWLAHRRPCVGLLAIGDELVPPGRPLAPGQLYVSNLYALEALCVRYGAETRRLGIVGDEPRRIEAALRSGLEGAGGAAGAAPCDVLLTLGGSLQGDFDFAGRALAALGARPHFQHTRINMGGSTHFATRGDTLCFGLPGTPMASWLAFELLVRPALWKLAGRRTVERICVPARLTEAYDVRPGRTYFVPARVDLEHAGGPRVQPLVRGTPLALPPSVLANALIRWPEAATALAADATVPVELLGDA